MEHFQIILVTKEGEPDSIPLSTNINLNCIKRMMYFSMDFGELIINGLCDTGALSSAFPEMDLWHPGKSKMLQEIRRKQYYPSLRNTSEMVEGCQRCAKNKGVPNATITPELLILPEWDLGHEVSMQIDVLPNLPPNGAYENVLTAIDVFSRISFAYSHTKCVSNKRGESNN